MLKIFSQKMALPVGISAGLHLIVGGAIFISSLSNPSFEPVGMSVVMVDLVAITEHGSIPTETKDEAKLEDEIKVKANQDEVDLKLEKMPKAKVEEEVKHDSIRSGPDVMLALLSEQVFDSRPGVMGAGGEERRRFLQEVRSRLEQAKRYPWRARMRGQEGTVRLEFVINGEGKAEKIRLVESSRWRILDDEAVATVGRVKRFPGPPNGWNREVSIRVPLVFKLEDR